MKPTLGNRLLREWLAKPGAPSQRALARRLPVLTQPLLSRLSRQGCPTLSQAVVLHVATHIPVDAWLDEGLRNDLETLRSAT